jgi:hypothetical protein
MWLRFCDLVWSDIFELRSDLVRRTLCVLPIWSNFFVLPPPLLVRWIRSHFLFRLDVCFSGYFLLLDMILYLMVCLCHEYSKPYDECIIKFQMIQSSVVLQLQCSGCWSMYWFLIVFCYTMQQGVIVDPALIYRKEYSICTTKQNRRQ